MKPRPPVRLLLLALALAAGPAAARSGDEPPSLDAAELRSVRALYAAAQQKEADALAAFREIRAMQASRSLHLSLEDARARLHIPAPERPPLDLSVLELARPDPARVVEQRQTLRAVNERIDEILAFVRQLKEQLERDEAAAETITLEALRADLARRETATALAAEDAGQPSKDLTDAALRGETPPAEAAAVDATIAQRAAAEARAMARQAADTGHHSAGAAASLANQARAAADQAAAAARAAREATSAGERPRAAEHAALASARSLEAVNAAIQVAQLTGNLSFVAAEHAHAQAAAQSRREAAAGGAPSPAAKPEPQVVTARQLGGFAPGAKEFLPGEGRPSRRIGAQGSGVPWIFVDSWYILGPFPNPNRRNVDTSFPPESIVDLDATYQGAEGRGLRWQFIQSRVPGVVPEEPREYAIYYAYSEVWSDQDVDLWVMLGSDDNSRVWLNERQIWKSGYELKTWRLDEGLRKVSFRRGINRILYRVENGWGATVFSFAINLRPAGDGE